VVTVDSAAGNYLTLDLGSGRFALYAHLQPGSLKVKLGDHVNAGQALARLGNSGNSDAPHLRFQSTDGNSPMGSEGIPYELSIHAAGSVGRPRGAAGQGKSLETKDSGEAGCSSGRVSHRQSSRELSMTLVFG
jgi:hypothetical protein